LRKTKAVTIAARVVATSAMDIFLPMDLPPRRPNSLPGLSRELRSLPGLSSELRSLPGLSSELRSRAGLRSPREATSSATMPIGQDIRKFLTFTLMISGSDMT